MRVWERWLQKGSLIMEGQRTSATEIALNIKDDANGGRLVLRRIRATP